MRPGKDQPKKRSPEAVRMPPLCTSRATRRDAVVDEARPHRKYDATAKGLGRMREDRNRQREPNAATFSFRS